MKSVMLSIQPKWCEKIVKGEKTIEVRKSRPKIETPFKCYIYCTKASKKYQTICGCMVINTDELYRLPNGKIKHDWSGELMCCNGEYTRDNFLNGKVIGEFVCAKIYTYYADDFVGSEDFDGTIITEPKEGEFAYWIPNQEDTCLRYLDIKAYGKGKTLYGWHISDLKIYDKPKELSEFRKPFTPKKLDIRKFIIKNGINNIAPDFKSKYDFCDKITRPPQSWCYVESLGE